ncbi:hypothetical protein D6C99_04771 [Aureobasidium pullulans]|nr:hypothetical protein D6C99_04771 [Aureobasidium pullulans]
MASRLSQFSAATDGDKTLYMNMLATYLDKTSLKYMDLETWPSEDEQEYAEITSLADNPALETILAKLDETESSEWIAEFLQNSKTAVHNTASRDLLGDATVDKLKLLLEFCDFFKHSPRVVYLSLDRKYPYHAEGQAEPLDEIRRSSRAGGIDFAAGWRAGDNGQTCAIDYVLCKEYSELNEPDEPWKWRIFVANMEYGFDCFDSLHDLLSWYCKPSDWIEWSDVQRSGDSLHRLCKAALVEGEN